MALTDTAPKFHSQSCCESSPSLAAPTFTSPLAPRRRCAWMVIYGRLTVIAR